MWDQSNVSTFTSIMLYDFCNFIASSQTHEKNVKKQSFTNVLQNRSS